jgi:hypothetical protein
MLPAFIGIGGQRCGSTWLFNVLKEHPSIQTAKEKEVHFFSYYHHFGYEWYESQFRKHNQEKIFGEFSTSYLYDNQVPLRILKYNPEIKIIVCIRNPIERAISHHRHEIQGNRISKTKLSFEQAIDKNPSYLTYGLYFDALEYWLKIFSLEQIHTVVFDDIINEPEKVVLKLYQYLRIDYRYRPTNINKKINQSVIPLSTSFSNFQRSVTKTARKLGLGNLVDVTKNIGLKTAIEKINSNDSSGQTFLQSETKDYLREYFSDDVKKLSNLLKIDLSRKWLQ